MRPTRRALLIGSFALFARPLAAAQQRTVPRIALFVYPRRPEGFPYLGAFTDGLRDAGWIPSHNVTVTMHYGESVDDLPRAAAALVDAKPDVIVTNTTSAAAAVKRASQTIPVVMAFAGDPVGAGVVASLAKPGANVTGLTVVAPETAGLRLQFLHETTGAASSIAACHPGLADSPVIKEWLRQNEAAASRLRLRLTVSDIGTEPRMWAPSFAALSREGVRGVSIVESPVVHVNGKLIADVALNLRLPSIFGSRQVTDAGGLMSYGANPTAMFRRAAAFVDKILRGARPADLPVETPREFELVINGRTAKALGLTIPPSLLLRADQVIE